MRPWVTVSQSDLIGFAISTDDLIEQIYFGVQDFSDFDAHCGKLTVLNKTELFHVWAKYNSSSRATYL